MKYGIIICPKCKRSKGVILNYKTTKCNICGKLLKFNKIRVLYKTNSQKELRHAIGLINADLVGKLNKNKLKH
jgi:hypothetical protein